MGKAPGHAMATAMGLGQGCAVIPAMGLAKELVGASKDITR